MITEMNPLAEQTPKSQPETNEQSHAFIYIAEHELKLNVQSFDDALLLLVSAMRQCMGLQQAMPGPDSDPEIIYDKVNDAVAAILLDFMPSEALTSEEADQIISQENEQLRQALLKLKATNPRLYRRNVKAYNKAVSEQRARALEAIQAQRQAPQEYRGVEGVEGKP